MEALEGDSDLPDTHSKLLHLWVIFLWSERSKVSPILNSNIKRCQAAETFL